MGLFVWVDKGCECAILVHVEVSSLQLGTRDPHNSELEDCLMSLGAPPSANMGELGDSVMSGLILPDGTIELLSNIVEETKEEHQDIKYVPTRLEIVDRARSIVNEFRNN
jgi:hypothetical protein